MRNAQQREIKILNKLLGFVLCIVVLCYFLFYSLRISAFFIALLFSYPGTCVNFGSVPNSSRNLRGKTSFEPISIMASGMASSASFVI
jgi:hypothetical protein